MRNYFCCLLCLCCTVVFSQAVGDSIFIDPSTLPHINEDTNHVNDVILMHFELGDNDTMRNQTKANYYKIDNKGRIITGCSRRKDGVHYNFYNYDKYPDIYQTESKEFTWFNIIKCNKEGLPVKCSYFSKRKGRKLYVKDREENYRYSLNNKLELIQVKDGSESNYNDIFEYDTKSRLIKYSYTQNDTQKRFVPAHIYNSKFEVNYIVNDSSFASQTGNADSITIKNTIFYDKSYKIISEKLYNIETHKHRSVDGYCCERHYLYDEKGRMTERKSVQFFYNYGNNYTHKTYTTIEKYIYNIDKIININQVGTDIGFNGGNAYYRHFALFMKYE